MAKLDRQWQPETEHSTVTGKLLFGDQVDKTYHEGITPDRMKPVPSNGLLRFLDDGRQGGHAVTVARTSARSVSNGKVDDSKSP
jgi:hypothetical protein